MATTEEAVDEAVDTKSFESPGMRGTPPLSGSCFGNEGEGARAPPVDASFPPPLELLNLSSPSPSSRNSISPLNCFWRFFVPPAASPPFTGGTRQHSQPRVYEPQQRRKSRMILLLLVYLIPLIGAICFCIPPLLRSLLTLLVMFEPSPLRRFSLACLAAEGDGFGPAERSGGGVGLLAMFADGNEAAGCQALMQLPKVWKAKPLFGAFTHAAQASTLCFFACARSIGLGPLLPPPATVRHYIQRIGPTLSALYLLGRMSHQPVQPPCEEWVFVRKRKQTREMVHTAGCTYTVDQSLKASPYDFVIVGGGTSGSTLAGLLSRLQKQSPKNHKADDKLHAADEGNGQGARVLLLEAGGWPDLRGTSPLRVPARTMEGQRGDMDWHLKTIKQTKSCKGLGGSQSFWPRGRGLGGSSWLNYMLYVRGDPRDFESFSKCTGDERWRFKKILEHYKRIEAVHFPADPAFRGREGPLSVSLQRSVDPTVLAFVRSAELLRSSSEEAAAAATDDEERGGSGGVGFYAVNADYNGERHTGPSLFQYNTRNGRRRTPLEAFLFDSKFEKEEYGQKFSSAAAVSVVFHARVVKVLFDEVKSSNLREMCRRGADDVCPVRQQAGMKRESVTGGPLDHTLRATGLLIVDGRFCNAEKWEAEQCQVYELPVGGELILSAGAIHTPQILLHSGVGDPAELSALGLRPLVNLPGVGKNLQDHIFTPRTFLLKDEVPLDKFASSFPPAKNASSSSDKPQETEKEAWVDRITSYASVLHTSLSIEVREGKEEDKKGDLWKREGHENPQLIIRTANERRGRELSSLWQYLAHDAGILTSPGVEAQVLSENFDDLNDDENPSSSSSPSSYLEDSRVPDIQLHFLNGLPDATYMTTRLNLPPWFPFFVGSPDKWGGKPNAPHLHGVVMMPVLLHPRSRGSVTLRKRLDFGQQDENGSPASNPPIFVNPLQPPQIDPNYLSSERDVEALVKGFEMAKSITTSGPFKHLVKEELTPHCRPEIWRQVLKENPFTAGAYVGLERTSPPSIPASKALDKNRREEEACDNAKCVLDVLREKLNQQFPELEKIDAVLPELCALAMAFEKNKVSETEWARGFVRLFTLTLYHPVGTCRMGKGDTAYISAYHKSKRNQQHCHHDDRERELVNLFNPTVQTPEYEEEKINYKKQNPPGVQPLPWSQNTVVDGALKLCGGLCVNNIRVVDASVFPHLTSGNTHAPAVVLAHVAFDAIREEWKNNII